MTYTYKDYSSICMNNAVLLIGDPKDPAFIKALLEWVYTTDTLVQTNLTPQELEKAFKYQVPVSELVRRIITLQRKTEASQ